MDEGSHNDEESKSDSPETQRRKRRSSFKSIKQIVEERKKKRLIEELDESPGDITIDDKDWDMSMSPLQYAVFFGRKDCVSSLLSHQADINQLLSYKNGSVIDKTYNLLHLCLMNNQYEVAKFLISKDINVFQLDYQHETVLHKAAASLKLKFLALFIDHDVPVKGKSTQINNFNLKMKTPLTLAMRAKTPYSLSDPVDSTKWSVIRLLVKNGADVHYTKGHLPDSNEMTMFNFDISNQRDEGSDDEESNGIRESVEQPIICAIKLGSPELVQFLINSAPNPKTKKLLLNFAYLKQTPPRTPLDFASLIVTKLEKSFKEKNWKDSLPKQKNFLYYLKSMYHAAQDISETPESPPIDNLKFIEDLVSEYEYAEEEEIPLEGFSVVKNKSTILKRRKEIVSILEKKGAKKFVDLKDVPKALQSHADNDSSQDSDSEDKEKEKEKEIQFTFESVVEEVEGMDVDSVVYEEQKPYFKLFEATFFEKEYLIDQLTVNKPIGKQLHVSSSNVQTGIPLLFLPLMRDTPKIFEKLFQICMQQYTPLKGLQKVEETAKNINNYDLAAFDTIYIQSHYEKLNPNEKSDNTFNSLTGPRAILQETTNGNWNILHHAAYFDSEVTLTKLIYLVKFHDINWYGVIRTKRSKELLKYLASDKTDDGLTPFDVAMARGNTSTAKVLMQIGLTDLFTNKAVEEGYTEYKGLDVKKKKMDWVNKMYSVNEDPNEKLMPIHIAVIYNQIKSAYFLLNEASLEWQSLHGNQSNEFSLYALGPDRNTAFHYAVKYASPELLKLLLSYDKKQSFDQQNRMGFSPIHYAAFEGKNDYLKILVENGSSFELKDFSHWTPLFHSIYGNQKSTLMYLIKEKVNLNAVTKNYKQTPLMLAAYHGKEEFVEILLKSNADPSLLDLTGNTALHYAVKNGHASIVKLLTATVLKNYKVENSFGLSVMDISTQKILCLVPKHETPKCDVIPDNRKETHDHISETIHPERILVSNTETNFTSLFLDFILTWKPPTITNPTPPSQLNFTKKSDFKNQVRMFKTENHKIKLPEYPSIHNIEDIAIGDLSEEENTLQDMVFYISPEHSEKEIASMETIIEKHGGEYEGKLSDRVTHVIVTNHQPLELIQKAKAKQKHILTNQAFQDLLKK
eukprot:TRINITY_DN2780_c0_g3_i1.p1 TRINITY_DN2780_c0_g3~~TRINITY_DN2780_c0_g3_i1.p1  ORF type:complete len:1246 (+),score=443.17 TRINITY_DN2780_c0_g3_i1:328-3738(+)